MLEVRRITEKEEKRHKGMSYVIELNCGKHFFSTAALVELSKKVGVQMEDLQEQGYFDEEYPQG